MSKLAIEVRVTGDRSSEMGQMLLEAIARHNRRLKDQAKIAKKRKEADASTVQHKEHACT